MEGVMMAFSHCHGEKIHEICTYPADPNNILFVWVTENDFSSDSISL
jgi:hypothetical protein